MKVIIHNYCELVVQMEHRAGGWKMQLPGQPLLLQRVDRDDLPSSWD